MNNIFILLMIALVFVEKFQTRAIGKNRERDTLSAEISCFHDYGQGLALSLLYYLEIARNHRQQ